ncbi:MAG TPA: glutathione S-transferase family protein [Candidatus Polarisedimenticolia bacterium]|jgi:glutathione S-transferase|nr:glutathione S-transferase family protein [Candidatus Polarisedimenticolia bacterium]
MLTLYRVEMSTNVERVALALAHKGLKVKSVVMPFGDRTEVRQVSGQDLVPVLVDDGKVVVDSMEIVRYLEDKFADTPPLYPKDPARRAECMVFIDWFNRVWKRPPNDMEAELTKPEGQRDLKRVERLGRAMQGYLDLFEQMLTGRDYLLGEFSAADVAAFPFVRYATIQDPNDPHLFHKILVDYQKPGKDHPRVVDWIARMDRRPRA